MKVQRIKIKNFRNISDATLDLESIKFVILRGQNRQGKTSVSEAISLALTPTTTGLTAKGDGYARKIKNGETKSIIEVDLQGVNRTIRRTVNLGFTGRTQSSEDINDAEFHPAKFDNLLETKKTALNISINTRAFQSMIYSGDEKAQKNLLAQLVLPARYDFPKETIADVESVIGEGTINFNGEPFAVIESAYSKLFKERTDVNRKVKEFIIPDALPRPQGVDSESLKAKLTSQRAERQKHSAAKDENAKKVNEEALKKDRAKAKIETLEKSLKESEESLRVLQESIILNPSAVQEIAGRKNECDRLLAEKNRLSGVQEFTKEEWVRLQKLSRQGTKCPTCDQEIDSDKVAQLIASNTSEQKRIRDEHEAASKSQDALGDVDGAIAKLDKHNAALTEEIVIATKIEEQTKALKEARAEAKKITGGVYDSTSLDHAIAQTDRNIEEILTQIQPVIAAEEREKEITTKTDQKKRLEDKATKLDTLVKYFDKDGIKAKLIAEFIGSFEQKINSVLSAWNYSCSISIEPFKFEITDYRKVSTPLIELSGAEEIMFYAAFQCAVSRTAGIGFVVIDKVDTLLPDLRPSLFKNLYKMLTDKLLDQVILLVADTSEQVPKLADSAFFCVEEGNIRRLG